MKGNKGKILLNRDRLIEEFKQELESKLRENMPPPRQVSSVLKVRVNEYDTSAILTIWTPNEDIVDIFKEGTTISIRNIFASGKRYEFYTLRKKKKKERSSFHRSFLRKIFYRAGDLQLTASRNTLFNKEGTCKDFFQSRIYTPLRDINDPSFNPLYGEFDTVGIVSSIVNCPYVSAR